MVRVWYMDDEETADVRLPHMTDPPNFVSLDALAKFGVNYWQVDADNYATCPELQKIRKERLYDYEDQIVCSKYASGYEDMTGKQTVFPEHMHSDDEVRLVMEGSGYFDIRNPENDKWIRIEAAKNDLVFIPPGLYHRMILDEKDYIKLNRYFVGKPGGIPLNRPQDDNPIRIEYLKNHITA